MSTTKQFFSAKNFIMFFGLAGLLFSLTFCSKFDDPAVYIPPAVDTVQYIESNEDFSNPERGFYRAAEVHTTNYKVLDVAQMKTWRTLQQADGGSYKLYSSLVFRQIVFEGFTHKDLSQEVLDSISKDFTAAREAGMKLVLRFCYPTTAHAGSCPESFICPPYGDASKEIILKHIAQLKPLLKPGKKKPVFLAPVSYHKHSKKLFYYNLCIIIKNLIENL